MPKTSSVRSRNANLSLMNPDSDPEIVLSVIMPVFNEAKTVGMMIHRVLKEIPHRLELIVIDDGSTDGSCAIADECAREDSRVRVLHQKNEGKTSALRHGFD